jgi:hypothetical protein
VYAAASPADAPALKPEDSAAGWVVMHFVSASSGPGFESRWQWKWFTLDRPVAVTALKLDILSVSSNSRRLTLLCLNFNQRSET